MGGPAEKTSDLLYWAFSGMTEARLTLEISGPSCSKHC